MANVILKDLYKKYAGKNAVNNLSATIPSGELTVITGPTGAGKSALIRTICGLDNADGGTISIDGVVVNRLEPKDRDVAIVLKGASFHQNQTVYENMAFGLGINLTARSRETNQHGELALLGSFEGSAISTRST
ncbi:MAG: ATP-binding cassette domain-containing protein, partial [Clostridia bacterium]|nr:ATP-binding cassette domain-containing protein [Clostridia bacterium]